MIQHLRQLHRLCLVIALGLSGVTFAQPDLLDIAEDQTAEEIAAAIEAGASTQARNRRGETALILAAGNNDDPAAVKTLLEAGADVNARNIEGVTALMAAVRYGYPSVLSGGESSPGIGAPAEQSNEAPSRQERFSASLDRPLAVMLDNVQGYPQAGLHEASVVVEMPVAGGLTQLMSVYDRSYPVNVGPVHGAHDYFYTLVQNMEGILVHDGGSPSALDAISRSSLPAFNAATNPGLFDYSDEADTTTLFSNGAGLRDAINRLRLQRPRLVGGTEYRASANATLAGTISVRYSDSYSSGFGYRPETDQYRWIRNGRPAFGATGDAVWVDAVVVANIVAQPIPGNETGQLYIPLSGGEATVYVNGRAVPGRWNPSGGFQFIAAGGEMVDLVAFKHWILFVPQQAVAEVSAESLTNLESDIATTSVEKNDNDEAEDAGPSAVPPPARLGKNLAVVQALLMAGADVDARNAESQTALMWAAERTDNPQIVRELLAAGANVDAQDDTGYTALMLAVTFNSNVDVVRALLSADPRIDVRHDDGSTALMLAAANSQEPVVLELLLDAGADASLRDRAGRTAFQYADQNTALRDTDVYWQLNDASFD